tara:strand:- start:97 stop:315 length:219 start_codon:yes stop_codon:yes gene_type:complete
MPSGSDHKLYARVACSLCLGGIREGIFTNCPYCDKDRMTYIEASLNTLKENLKENLTVKEKINLIAYLQKDK